MTTEGVLNCDPRWTAMMGWVLLHGFASLYISGVLESVEGMDSVKLKSMFLDFYSQGKLAVSAPPQDPPDS